jgi:hypothetical protein
MPTAEDEWFCARCMKRRARTPPTSEDGKKRAQQKIGSSVVVADLDSTSEYGEEESEFQGDSDDIT